MRNTRLTLPLIAAGLLAVPGSATAMVPTNGLSVSLPAVPGIQALEVCAQAGRAPSCQKVATPHLRSGRISVRWNRSLRTGVTAKPLAASSKQCEGRRGTGIRVSTSDVATDIAMAVDATYAGVTTPKTVVSVRRTLKADQGAAIWACLL